VRVAVLIVLTVLTLASSSGCSGMGSPRHSGTLAPAASTVTISGSAAQLEQQYEQVVRSVLPSVVQITTDQGEGSGVVYDDRGHIVTNAHVVAGASRFKITPASGGKALTGRLVGMFPPDDLAVVKVNGASLRPASFGDSGRLQVGQIVMAMGSPLGLSGSVTNGIVSGVGRTVSSEHEGAFPGATISSAVQTSAAINPGNSGGALVTLSGQVVGVPTLIAATSQGQAAQGIGFAVPSNTVKSIAPQLIRNGKVTSSGRAALGVSVGTVVDQSSGEPAGVGVVEVSKGSGAEKAGLQKGDIIIAVNGMFTPTQADLAKILAGLRPGDTVRITLLRNGGKRTIDVRLSELPSS
jgi:putative serine protease PepD